MKRYSATITILSLLLALTLSLCTTSCNSQMSALDYDGGTYITVYYGQESIDFCLDDIDKTQLKSVICSYADRGAVISMTYSCIALSDLWEILSIDASACTRYIFEGEGITVTTEGTSDWYLALGLLIEGEWRTLSQEQGISCITVNPSEQNGATGALNRLCWIKSPDSITLVME